jgi:hypothetical protein
MLPLIKEDLKREDFTLCQDADLAHGSKATLKYACKQGIKLLTLPSVSLDLLIAKTLAYPLKRVFYAKRTILE